MTCAAHRDSGTFGVWVGDRRVGTFQRSGGQSRFSLDLDYLEDADHPVLGAFYKDHPLKVEYSSMRIARWFSNLLPEGKLRDLLAGELGMHREREMDLLAHVGRDLPGAVWVLPDGEVPGLDAVERDDDAGWPGVRFSLAGVGMKFSLLRQGNRLTVPAGGVGGDWIVKIPAAGYSDVPFNEFAMMTLAGAVGIDMPEVMVVPRKDVDPRLPEGAWPGDAEFAYATRRFDRDGRDRRIHIEDFAQVRNTYPVNKYKSTFEAIAGVIHRWCDTESLLEFTRRLTFSILISNGDYHLKNWSLIYPESRLVTLAPAYDLVSTASYVTGQQVEDLGLKFGGSKDFHQVSLVTFTKLQERLGVNDIDLAECAAATVERTLAEWPRHASLLDRAPRLQKAIDQSIAMRGKTIMRSPV